MADEIPESNEGRALQAHLSPERWARVVAEAVARAAVFDAVVDGVEGAGATWRSALVAVSAETPWPTFMNWKRRCEQRTGPTWERLLDERSPPPRQRLAEQIRAAAITLRHVDRSMSTDVARKHLVTQFGQAGQVSDASLRRMWAAAGVRSSAHAGGRGRNAKPVLSETVAEPEQEEVEHLHGGVGLALLAAAEADQGFMLGLAKSALAAGAARVKVLEGKDLDLDDDAADRDDLGRFTPEYNARRRGDTPAGQTDGRWATDAVKASQRPLATLPTLTLRAETLACKMLSMGATPLLTERRGFDGLEGASGEWLRALGGVAYMPATLDKTLAELGLLDAGPALWQRHARDWHAMTQRWIEPEANWLRTAVYIDGTADPYWTRAFAKSGKVSRVGRVMPCVSRIAVNSGAGVPLLVETHAGTVSLKKRLLPMLAELDAAIGAEAGVGRLTVVDSEVGTGGMMWAMHGQTQMIFITVLKGQVLTGARISHEQAWQPYRERDEVREVHVHLRGKGVPEEGLTFRGVEMRRGDSRHPHTTLFATNAADDELPANEVANHYLGRWPRQEQLFRNARNGGGLNRSHGYGGGEVLHVSLVSKRERADHAVTTAKQRNDRAIASRAALAKDLADKPGEARKLALALADKQVRDTEKQSKRRLVEQSQLATMPEQIYQRDTGRDSIMTCLKLTVMAMLEFVMKEYLGGAAMEWRTFIEQLVSLPVTMRSSEHCCRYQFHANPRNPALMVDLAIAVTELNRRALRRGGQRLVFELLPAVVRGP